MFIKEKIYNKVTIVKILQKIYIIKNLKVNILLSINILVLEEAIINLLNQVLKISKVKDIKILIQVKIKDNININQFICVKKLIVISAKSIKQVSIQLIEKNQILLNRDFLFKSQIKRIYIYFVNLEFHSI